jgi:hypothetical protein
MIKETTYRKIMEIELKYGSLVNASQSHEVSSVVYSDDLLNRCDSVLIGAIKR